MASTHNGSSSSSSPSPNSQYIQQFLSSILSQRGPSAVPYSEDVKWLIRQHLVSLSESFPSLLPKSASYTHNDGRAVNLLQAEGTVPVPFQGITYNIPIVLWLMESYPRHPPLVYVNPTRDMVIKRPHPFVNPSGVVSIPYLQNWVYPSSNLVDLVRNLSHFFGQDPPLYSQRRPNQNPIQSPNPNNFSPSPVPTSNPANIARPAIPPRTYPQSPYGGSGRIMPQSQSQSPQRLNNAVTDDPNEVFKRNAINKLVENLHGDIAAMRKAREAEMEGLFSAQAVLRQRDQQLSKGLKEMQDEKEGLEQHLQMVLTNADVLEGWLMENEGKKGVMKDVNVDDAFEICDPLSKQMLECTASDLAIEDVVYSLDKAAQEGSIPFDQYLRQVRILSRDQFFHRATASKVRAVQMQAQVNTMASRASQYAK
ncbi:protein ELC-like [Impatiens glandulifera]|uniref:protein ELC-like n=1 Tax=Impatiens glandulifera TaxID=253017 RepID=UPI001FB050E9|nr:protein ELC-like [Impatiens glandulifera]